MCISWICLAYAHARFRQVPTFGRDTIRRFGRNVSDMKKLAGRDFEDILQVCTFYLTSESLSQHFIVHYSSC
jgi:hypothetical protein